MNPNEIQCKSKLLAGKPAKLVYRSTRGVRTGMKTLQETERPPQLVVPVSGRLKLSRKQDFQTAVIKRVLLSKKRDRNPKIFRSGLEEGPGARKTLNTPQFTHFQIPTSRRS